MSKSLIVSVLVILLLTCCQKKANNKESSSSPSNNEDPAIVLKEAYIYSLPLVLMDLTRRQMTQSSELNSVPNNQFKNNSFFPDAKFKNVVRPNSDTYYSSAWLNLADGPVILSIPNTKGRYHMFPLMDAYSNIFYSIGTRTTGNNGGIFLITGPKWTGSTPEGMKQIPSPTDIVWVIGRTQVNSKEDGEKVVVPLQHQYKIISLNEWGKQPIPSKIIIDPTVPKEDPNTVVKTMTVENYFNYANELLAKNPPPEADKAVLNRFASVGIGTGKKFDLNTFSDDKRKEITEIPKTITNKLAIDYDTSNMVNGWNLGRKVIGTYGTDYQSRASTAYMGLGANLREDAIYSTCFVDRQNKELNGSSSYKLHFEKGQTPPVNAFWSITLYDTQGYFIDNELNRYTLGDRSNLRPNADGSIDIFIQHSHPGKEKTSNWLPAPKGNFNLLLRFYWPKSVILQNKWSPPFVEKI